MPKKITLSEIKNRLLKIFGYNIYDYSMITEENYIDTHTKVPIKCIKHNHIFYMATHVHEQNHGCKICSIENNSAKMLLTLKEFIDRSKIIHNNKYSYKNFIYFGCSEKSCITCSKHGEFLQNPSDHLYSKNGCPKCGLEITTRARTLTHEQFLERFYSIFGYEEYKVLENYKGMFKKILLYHNVCDEKFLKSPDTLLNQNQGCPVCKESHGERRIRFYLKNNKIKFERQKQFSDCFGPSLKKRIKLRFDFCVYDNNDNILFLIEYNGTDHYPPLEKQSKTNPIRFNQTKYEYCQIRDNIKKDYCEKNNIKLLVIPYWEEDNIENIITQEIKNAK